MAIRNDGNVLFTSKYCDKFKEMKEYIEMAIHIFLSLPEWQQDQDILQGALERDGTIYESLTIHKQRLFENVIIAARSGYDYFADFHDNRCVMLEVLKRNGMALRYASDRLKW